MAMKGILLKWLSLIVVITPSIIKLMVYRRVYRYSIGRNVRIGLSWIWVGRLHLGDNVQIGHFNRFKNIPDVEIGNYTVIGTGNTFTSSSEFTNDVGMTVRGNKPMLVIGEHCGISLMHYFDIQDRVEIGAYTTIAGKGSDFFTHYLDVVSSTQSTKPIGIGKYCIVGSSTCFTPGARIADYSVVGMGAVVTREHKETHCLIGGNPAVIIHKLPRDAAYFKRNVGWVGSFAGSPFESRRSGR